MARITWLWGHSIAQRHLFDKVSFCDWPRSSVFKFFMRYIFLLVKGSEYDHQDVTLENWRMSRKWLKEILCRTSSVYLWHFHPKHEKTNHHHGIRLSACQIQVKVQLFFLTSLYILSYINFSPFATCLYEFNAPAVQSILSASISL